MKSLSLSKAQEEKLLEMCKALFPEYEDIVMSDDGVYDPGTEHIIFYEKHIPGRYSKAIHWFEFCLTHLVEKILNPYPDKPNRSLKSKFQEFFWSTNMYWTHHENCSHLDKQPHDWEDPTHPVDYLYTEFKKLKQ